MWADAGPVTAAGFAISVAAPIYALTYLAGLHRIPETSQSQPLEWYPVGHILAWAAIMGGLISAIGIFAVGQSEQAYLDAVKTQLEKLIPAQEVSGQGQTGTATPGSGPPATGLPPLPGGGIAREETLTFISRIMVPASFAIGWLWVTLFNMWMAAKLLHGSQRLMRPWPHLPTFELPRYFSLLVAIAILLGFLPGLIGIFASGFMGAFFFIYLLLGMAVIHVITHGMRAREFVLGAIYMSVLFLQIGIFVILLGLAEQVFKLRRRALTPGPDE